MLTCVMHDMEIKLVASLGILGWEAPFPAGAITGTWQFRDPIQ